MNETAVRIAGFSDLDESKMSYWYEPAERTWYLWIPGCGLASLKHHGVIENPDKTITVTPSIKTTGHDSGKPVTRHGYLTAGIWIEC
jgi:hypothetical protein